MLFSACTPRFAAERWVLGERVMQTRDIAYGDAERQQLDVYRPLARGTRAPVVIFLYGGRWKYGSKDDYLLVGNSFARRGWVTVIPNYRLYPEALFPAWVEDGARAVRWTVDNIARFGGDTSRIVVVGHSAGAHTAALLALEERYLREAGVPEGALKGFVSIAGPVDTTWTAPDVQRLMGPPEGWPASYASTHVDGTGPRCCSCTVTPTTSSPSETPPASPPACAQPVPVTPSSSTAASATSTSPSLSASPASCTIRSWMTSPASSAIPTPAALERPRLAPDLPAESPCTRGRLHRP